MLGYMFPQEKTTLQAMAGEAALSRLYGGIHIGADNEVGLAMGRWIGSLANARAMADDIETLTGQQEVDRPLGSSLIATLETVVANVNQKDMPAAIGGLEAFISKVQTVKGSTQGQRLGEAAREIIYQWSS